MSEAIKEAVALITGAGSGLGRACSLAMAKAGWRIFGVDKNAAGLAETAALVRREGGLIETFALNLVGEQAPQQTVAACLTQFGRLDALINNAGQGSAPAMDQTTDELLDFYIALNFKLAFYMCRSAIPEMQRAGGGAIVNIASALGLVGFPSNAAYSAAKSALIGMSRQLVAQYGRSGIRVNVVAPGIIATPATEARLAEGGFGSALDTVPAGRPGAADEIASAVTFLAGPDASYVSGQVLAVDGGWTATRGCVK